MLNQLKSLRVVYQRITGNTCLGLIGLGEAAVNHHEFAVGLDGVLALDGLDGHMAVDNVTMLTFNTELVKNHIDNLGIITHCVIGTFNLLVGFLVGNEIALESSHLALVECG